MRRFYLLFIIVLSGCIIDDGPATFPAGIVEGYRPIYSSEEIFSNISFRENVPLVNPGKIYTFGRFLLVAERSRGVHIYDNADVTSPAHLGFISIAANEDIALKGNVLYADHGNDLLAIDISDVTNPVILDRQEDVYEKTLNLPPGDFNYFECVDQSRAHLITGWQWTTLDNPECYR